MRVFGRTTQSADVLCRPSDDPAALRRYLALTVAAATARARGASRITRSMGDAAVPLAYAAWIDYLFFLDALIASRLELRPSEIFPEERRGLELLRETREAFWRRHQLCAGCGALITRGGTCALCSLEFARGNRRP